MARIFLGFAENQKKPIKLIKLTENTSALNEKGPISNMLFLRLTIFLIIGLGALVYLISTKIRSEFMNTGEKIIPLFRGSSAEFKAFCKNPPTQYAAKLLKLRKKLSIALTTAFIAFFLAILAVILEQI